MARSSQPSLGQLPGGLAVACFLLMVIVPLPTIVVDLAIALSFSASIVTILMSLGVKRSTDFSEFPTLLLFITILRLSFNIATARLIISNGASDVEAAGRMVGALGSLLMNGNAVAGSAVFVVILLVNFIVVTKGAGRVAEVSARFFLDSLPGRQLAIDADLASGAVSEAVAQTRRRQLDAESSFYGAMDGASKFVRGDAVCALIIPLINMLGGLIIALSEHEGHFAPSFLQIVSLAIGDGLVSQIPAFLVSGAAAIVVSKGGAGNDSGQLPAALIPANQGHFFWASVSIAILGILPGMPMVLLWLVAITTWAVGVGLFKQIRSGTTLDPKPETLGYPNVFVTTVIDDIRIELGLDLLHLIGPNAENISGQIQLMRLGIAAQIGFIVPKVRILDNVSLALCEYRIYIRDVASGSGHLRPRMALAVGHPDMLAALDGHRLSEPIFGQLAMWVGTSTAAKARLLSCIVLDPLTVLIAHLSEVVYETIGELFTSVQTEKLLLAIQSQHSSLIADALPACITTSGLMRILQMLLSERVSIRDLPAIIDAIQQGGPNSVRSTPALLARVRTRLARQISSDFLAADGVIHAVILSQHWDVTFRAAITGTSEEYKIALDEHQLSKFVKSVSEFTDEHYERDRDFILLVSSDVRLHIQLIFLQLGICIPVLAQNEIYHKIKLKVLGYI